MLPLESKNVLVSKFKCIKWAINPNEDPQNAQK